MAIATCIEACPSYLIKRRTVADGVAIPKGTVCRLADPNTASATTANSEPFAGIALSEKTASDGITELDFATGGKWSMTSTAAGITAGAIVSVGGANTIEAAVESDFPLGCNIGKCLNTLGGGGGTAIVQVGAMV